MKSLSDPLKPVLAYTLVFDSEFNLILDGYSSGYGRQLILSGEEKRVAPLPAGSYTVVVYPKWGKNDENSSDYKAKFGSLLVDLYYPEAMGLTQLRRLSH